MTVEYLVDKAGIKKGTVKELPDDLAQRLIDRKIVKKAKAVE